MPPKTLTVAVDRIEGTIVVLEADDGQMFEVPIKSFRKRPREGMVYRVPMGKQPLWAKAVADPEEESRRNAAARKQMEELWRRDPGGDIKP
jgi:hypothetical protein